MPSSPILNPSGYTTSAVAAFADVQGLAALVSAETPLPVTVNPPATAPLAGETAIPMIAGPYAPVMGRSVILVLSGNWTGSVTVLRSSDQGANKLPITLGGTPSAIYSANCCEPVWDESETAAQLYLDIALTSGSVDYRMAQ